jgi:hypothetical protein
LATSPAERTDARHAVFGGVRVHRCWGGVSGELSPVTEGDPLGSAEFAS